MQQRHQQRHATAAKASASTRHHLPPPTKIGETSNAVDISWTSLNYDSAIL
jgi:hypothetical protein